MGQQMSADDQDEGFKNIISRMLQEADEEGETVEGGSLTKILNECDRTSGQDDDSRTIDKDKENETEAKTVIKSENCSKQSKESNDVATNNLKEESKDDIEKNSPSNTKGSNEKTTVLNMKEVKSEDNVSNNDNIEKDNCTVGKCEQNDTLEKETKQNESGDKKEEIVTNIKKTDAMEKPKSLETVFLKDRIDNLINTCLSSKSFEAECELKWNTLKTVVDKNHTALSYMKRDNSDTSNVKNSSEGTGHQDAERSQQTNDSLKSHSMNLKSEVKNAENQNKSASENKKDLLKQKEGISGSRETTTFQTLIEKVLDSSLSKNKVDSCQNSNGFRQEAIRQIPISDSRLANRNQLHTIKNEMRNELLVRDSGDRQRQESKQDDMSINRSKVVYLKDHIEKVLEKSFQNSSRRDQEEVRVQEKTPTKFDERHHQNKESEQRVLQRERSNSFVGEPVRHQRDRSHSFSLQGSSSELKRHKSLEAYDLEHLGPPKLIKVTEIYPDISRDSGRYLQPPRIDTYDGNSRASFKGSMSPGGNYSRSPLDQSPVSPYYNHSPNSWHGHSPRDQHVLPSNHSPNHSVPATIYQGTRYPVPANGSYPPGVAMTRYNNGAHVSHPSQIPVSASNRGFQPPYPQTAPLPGYLNASHEPRYQAANPQISPNAQHTSRHYPQNYPPRPMVNSGQNFHPEESGGHSKQQMAPTQHYQQMAPRQLQYPNNHPQLSQTLRQHPPYPTQTTQHMPRIGMPPAQHYPTNVETNPNFPPKTNMHHIRQSHGNPNFLPHGMNGRNNSAGFVDNTAARSAQRMSVPLQRSQYSLEGQNNRNPSVSSAMALGPVPPQNYFKQHQSQKPPQLFPSSPPIPSVREFSINSNRGSYPGPAHVPTRTEVKYVQPDLVDVSPRGQSRPQEPISRPIPVAAHEQPPVLDLSVKRDNSMSSTDPDMQPLDLTCKDKNKPNEISNQLPAGKGYTGFEYLMKGPFQKVAVSGPPTAKQSHPDTQYASRTQNILNNYDPPNKNDSLTRQSSEASCGSHGYSPPHIQTGHPCYKQNQQPVHPASVSPQDSNFSDEQNVSNEIVGKGQGQCSQLQSDLKKAPNVSRHEPIQNILGTHSPTDILYLICRLCGQTYGSPYGFRKHFRNQHGFEPRAEHTIVQTISETKTAMQSPPVNPQALMVAQPPNSISDSTLNESQISIAQNARTSSQANSSRPNSREIVNHSPVVTKDENDSIFTSENKADESNNCDRKYLECHECGQTFQLNDFGAYKRHCRQHGHPKINNPFDPNYTSEQQAKNVISGENFKIKDGSFGDISIVCKECNMSFASHTSLKEHMDKVHSELVGFKCFTCKEVFSEDSSYQNHLKSAHIEIKDFKENIPRNIGNSQKSDFDCKQEKIISSTSIVKSAADSMVTTASPDSSSDMVKKSSLAVDSQSGPSTPNVHVQSEKHTEESDSENKKELSRQNSCDSASQKVDDDLNNLYLHKKFGTKRKFISSSNNDVIEPKIFRKEVKSSGNTRSPSVLSTNSCDSEQSNGLDGKNEVGESDQESNISSVNVDGSDDAKDMSNNVKCSVSSKTEARHQLPFVWDRVTRSQVGRKPTKN